MISAPSNVIDEPPADSGTARDPSGLPPPAPVRSAVFLTHSSFSSPFRVGSHHLTKVLDEGGWRVLHVPTPITPAHFPLGLFKPEYRGRLPRSGGGLRPLFNRSCEYIPLACLPWQLARLAGKGGPALYAGSQLAAARRIRRAGFARPDLLFVDEPRMAAMARWFNPRVCLYRATDLYHEMKGDSTVLAAERLALQAADGFVATSAPVYDHLRALAPDKPGIMLENGVDLELFTRPAPEPADLRAIPTPRAIYVGALDARFDFEAVTLLARRRPDLSVVLIGPLDRKPGRVAAPPNLHFLGPRPYESLPAYLQHSTLGLLPLTGHAANRGRSPMKIYEYAAAGLPAVVSRTDELSRRQLPFVTTYENAEQLAAAVRHSLDSHQELARRAAASARQMSWHSRLQEILGFSRQLLAAKRHPASTADAARDGQPALD